MAAKSKFSRARVGAVISKNGRILSSGYNQMRHYKRLPGSVTKPFEDSMHAETAAIVSLLEKKQFDKLIGSTISVVRILKDNTCSMSKPCEFFYNIIRTVGIKRVVYTDSTGSVIKVKVN